MRQRSTSRRPRIGQSTLWSVISNLRVLTHSIVTTPAPPLLEFQTYSEDRRG